MTVKTFIIYLLAVNIFGFLIMLIDKFKAKRNFYRISEKFIFTLCFLGASIGIYIAMFLVKHKTRHKTFTIGVPLIFVLNIMCIYYDYIKNNYILKHGINLEYLQIKKLIK